MLGPEMTPRVRVGDLRAHGVDVVMLGQYLRPTEKHLNAAESSSSRAIERSRARRRARAVAKLSQSRAFPSSNPVLPSSRSTSSCPSSSSGASRRREKGSVAASGPRCAVAAGEFMEYMLGQDGDGRRAAAADVDVVRPRGGARARDGARARARSPPAARGRRRRRSHLFPRVRAPRWPPAAPAHMCGHRGL